MAADAAEVIAATGLDPESAVASREADMRFTGQAFEIVVPLPAGPFGPDSLPEIRRPTRRSMSRNSPAPRQRCRLRSSTCGFRCARRSADRTLARRRGAGARSLAFGAARATAVHDRARLGAGDRLAGPVIVEEAESTLVVGPEGHLRVLDDGAILVEVEDVDG